MNEVNDEESRYELTPFLVSYIEASIDSTTKETYLKHICHYYLKILINSYCSLQKDTSSINSNNQTGKNSLKTSAEDFH